MTLKIAINYIFQDWNANSTDAKGRFVLLHYRFCNLMRRKKILKLLFFWFFVYNKIFIQWVLNVEIGSAAIIGKNCKIFHGHGLVIHPNAVIGDNCIFRHGVTIGNKVNKDGSESMCPKIGNNVEFGAYSAVIGDVTVGDNVIIGIGTIIVKSVQNDTIVVGSENRYISRIF